jgi:hypothetical protein
VKSNVEGSKMRVTPSAWAQKRVAAAACLFLLVGSARGNGPEQPPVNRNLKILYAGHPGTEREKDFVGFLKKYFDVVRTGNLETFQEADTGGFDVTLLDWDWNVIRGPYPKVSQGFARPVITLGVRGGLICLNWRLKTAHW